jgi:hypothetical protein
MALPPTFTCAVCGQVFPQSPETVAEAEAEAAALWGVAEASQHQDMAVLCDACFQRRPERDILAMAADFQARTGGSSPRLRAKEDALVEGLLRAVGIRLPDDWWQRRPDDPAPGVRGETVDLVPPPEDPTP